MRSLFTSNSFLKLFAENFKALFTDKEIDCLLEIYQSKLMAKMLKHSEELFNPLYKAMKEQAEEIA